MFLTSLLESELSDDIEKIGSTSQKNDCFLCGSFGFPVPGLRLMHMH